MTSTLTDHDPLTNLERHITALIDRWTDRDGEEHPGLIACISQHLIPVRMADISPNVKTKITEGFEPWAADVGAWLTDIHYGARRLETDLRHLAWGNQPTPTRGGSLQNTVRALCTVEHLIRHLWEAPNGAQQARQAAKTIARWYEDGMLILGAQRRWSTIRWAEEITSDGPNGPVTRTITRIGQCPHCGSPVRIQPTLIDEGDPTRWLPGQTDIAISRNRPQAVCSNYDCRDAEGARHTWQVDRRLGLLLRQDTDTNRQKTS